MKALPEDAYKGKQQRLKQTLIQKAKLKKQYARVLKQEGMTESRAPQPINGAALPDQTGHVAYIAKTNTDATRESGNEDNEPKVTKRAAKSYRERVRARKHDYSAVKANEIKAEREQQKRNEIADAARIEKKRSERLDIKKREMSRTKKGQPLIKDRMKNILAKLQSEADQ